MKLIYNDVRPRLRYSRANVSTLCGIFSLYRSPLGTRTLKFSQFEFFFRF